MAAHVQIDEFESRIGIGWDGDEPITILSQDNHGYPYADSATPLTRYSPVDTTLRPSVDDDSSYQQVADVALDCVNQDGVSYLHVIHPPAQ